MLKKIFDINMRMSSITRYSQTHLVMSESVLEHTGSVCLMCYLIGMEVKKFIPVNMESLLKKAIVHDIDEIVTGDIPNPTKYANPEIAGAIHKVEHENMIKLSENLLDNIWLSTEWLYAKDNTIEGAILSIADCLSVLYKLWQETVLYNNKTMNEHVGNIKSAIKKLEIKYRSQYELAFIFDEAWEIYEEIEKNAYKNS